MEDPITTSHYPYTHLPDGEHAPSYTAPPADQHSRRRSLTFVLLLSAILAVCFIMGTMFLFPTSENGAVEKSTLLPEEIVEVQPRGVAEGVSMKSFRRPSLGVEPPANFPWNSNVLSWQRTSFHFQPNHNWMNGTFTITVHYLVTSLSYTYMHNNVHTHANQSGSMVLFSY